MLHLAWRTLVLLALGFSIYYADRAVAAPPPDMTYCHMRAAFAKDIARSVVDGFSLDSLVFAYLVPSQSVAEAADRQAWEKEFKDEIAELIGMHYDVDTIANRVLEKCAYSYGKTKRTANVPLPDELKEYCWYRGETLSDLWDVVKEVGSVEQMLLKFPPPPGLPLADARKLVETILESETKKQYLDTEWLKCTGGGI